MLRGGGCPPVTLPRRREQGRAPGPGSQRCRRQRNAGTLPYPFTHRGNLLHEKGKRCSSPAGGFPQDRCVGRERKSGRPQKLSPFAGGRTPCNASGSLIPFTALPRLLTSRRPAVGAILVPLSPGAAVSRAGGAERAAGASGMLVWMGMVEIGSLPAASAAPVPCMVQGGRTRLLHLTPSHPAKRVSPRACCRAVWSLQMRDQSQDHSIITPNSLAVSAFVLVPNYWGTSVPTLLPGPPAPAWQKRGSLKSCLIKAAALPQVSLIPTRILNLPFFPLFPLWFITSFPTDSIICLNLPPAIFGLHV